MNFSSILPLSLLLSLSCYSSIAFTLPSKTFLNPKTSRYHYFQKQQRLKESHIHQSFQDDNNEEEEDIFFDDFGDSVIGGGSSFSAPPPSQQNDFPSSFESSNNNDSKNEWMDTLNQRLSTLKSKTAQRRDLLTKNWSKGNWNVRGFALDKNDPTVIDEGKEENDVSGKRTLDGNDSSNAAAATGATYPTSFIGNSVNSQDLPSSQQSSSSQPSEQTEKTSAAAPIYISKIATDLSLHNPDVIAVGRTDGSVILVKIGTQYLTNFVSIPKIVYDEEKWAPDPPTEEGEGNGEEEEEEIDVQKAEENAPRLKIESELIDAADLADKLRDDMSSNFGPDSFQEEEDVQQQRSPYNYSPEDEEEMEDNYEEQMLAQIKQQNAENQGIPFQIIHQFNAAAENTHPITSLLYNDDVIYTAAGNNGDVQIWKIPDEVNLSIDEEEPNGKKMVIPLQTLSRAHSDTIVSLKTLSSSSSRKNEYEDEEEHDLLLSASVDGSFALWDLRTGDLIHRCQLSDDNNENDGISIQCADVDVSSSEGHVIYFGLNTGHVVGYTAKDVISAGAGGFEAEDNACPIPSCSFLAYESSGKEGKMMNDDYYSGNNNRMKGVTSILCAGRGLLSGGGSGATTSSIVTGGADGTVKQWEMMARKIPAAAQPPSQTPALKFEHWPRLSTQRMKQCAHLFTGHYGPITALACIDTAKVLSAGVDGTVRIWNRSGGTELYRMDGFTSDISSLCLEEDRLITNGMKEYVCLHDFEVDEIEEGKDYNLEDDW